MRIWDCTRLLGGLLVLLFTTQFLNASHGQDKNNFKYANLEPSASFLGEFYYERVGYHMENAGDVNGDGFEDFLIGTFHNTENGYDAGATYLILGHKDNMWGLKRRLNDADARFLGKYEYDAFGYYVSGNGDVNGDGYDDFVIGAPAGNEAGGPNPGYAFLFLGRANADWGYDCIAWHEADASFVGRHDYDHAGQAVAVVGDINKDGYDDFIIGAPLNDDGATEGGKTYLFLGKPDGWNRNIDIESADASFIGSYYRGWTGYVVSSAGDLNGDGFSDFLIGSPHHDYFGGRIYLFFGKSNIDWNANFNLDSANVILEGEKPGDRAGWSLACAGDVNNDGFSDILIGAYNNDRNGIRSGKVYLIMGKSDDWLHMINLCDADASWNGEKADDQAGWSVSGVPDMNYDGCDEILIGAWHNDYISSNAGKAYLIYGKTSGWEYNLSLSEILDYFVGEYEGDYAGYCVAGNDANGDGLGDPWISASYNSDNNEHAGKIYLVLSERDRYEVKGQVKYYSNRNPVPHVFINISGGITDSLLTNQHGVYSKILPHQQDYTLIPSKPANEDFDSDAIIAYDAALTLQAAVDIKKLDSLQKIAANADQDSMITAYDAALVARYVVGFEDSNSHVGQWLFSPPKKEYHDLNGHYLQQDFSAIIVGNVHGGWRYSDSISIPKSLSNFDLPKVIGENNQLKIPIKIKPGVNFLSLELRMSYPSNQFDFIEIQKSEIVSDFQLVTHQQSDRLRLVLFGSQAINKAGNLITLLFNLKKGSNEIADFKIEKYQINNYSPIQGLLSIEATPASSVPRSFNLFQNYPNPFNLRTSIRLLVDKNSEVKLVIYNMKGEIVKKLINKNLMPGHYTFHWDGVDEYNRPVGSGIYICRATSGNEDKSFKLLFIK